MNKNHAVGAISLGLTYAGCFFGAGFVSGQELWQFFGSFGLFGYLGILLAIALFFIFGVMLIRSVQLSGRIAFDEVIIIGNHSKLRSLLGIITVFLMFGIIVIMCAGSGSLLNQVLSLSPNIGCAIFCFAICIMAMNGISGVIKVFSFVVPILVIATLFICFSSISKYGINSELKVMNSNPLLSNWWFSALNYVSYNIISLVGTIIPVGMYVKDKRTAYSGVFYGCIIALSLAVGILLAITSMSASIQTELPMLDVAFTMNQFFGYLYAILLLAAMFGTSLACFAATTEFIKGKSDRAVKYELPLNIIISVIAYICSLAGFGTLVGTVYPVFGYIGFFVLFFIIHSFIKLKAKDGVF